MIWQNPLPFPKLREISIMGLPNSKYIWKNDPESSLSFKNLRQISVGNCWSLKNVFPDSIARDLPQLKDLLIFDCGVEEIVSKVEEVSDSEATITFEFNQLSSLVLWKLPECKCFYPGMHTTKWPMLKELQAHKCGKMSIFDPVFFVEKVIPKLQNLTLGSDFIAMISGDQFSSRRFHGIKSFKVEGKGDEFAYFQISFLERFNNLEELCISRCKIKELFYNEGDTGNKWTYSGTFSTIRKIELTNITNLKYYLWNQDEQVDRILPNLETLEVHSCEDLMSLGSSSASFQNLTTLEVWECRDMTYLDTCLAVQSLTTLKKLSIRDCVSMKEIVASEGDEAVCQVIFSRMKSLELENLPRLKSFCSGNHTFGFPCLEELAVSGCPELEIFCKGVLSAPLLQSVEYGAGKEHWSDDLNSTIQQLHSTKVWYRDIGCFVLSDFSNSIQIWKEKSLDFRNLEVLEVEECKNLKYIFDVSMALELVQLTYLKVKKCPMMEYIIKKGAEETEMDTVSLPNLWKIKLKSCSELTSFCMGSIALQCPSLKNIEINDCPKMYAVASPREVGEGDKAPFFNDKIFCVNLLSLIVKGCHNLEYLFPSSLITNFAGLEQLIILDCKNMEEVIFTDESAGAAATTEEKITETELFTKLTILHLGCLPKLETFWHGDNSKADSSTLFNQKIVLPRLNRLLIKDIGKCKKIWHDEASMNSFYELNFLMVMDCERLLNIFPLNMVEKFENLQDVFIMGCESMEYMIGADDDDRPHPNESHTETSTQSIELRSTTKFVFPQIRFLALCTLSKLKSFHSKLHTIEWPSLEKLIVDECNKVETFAGEHINFQETQPLVHQTLFWVTQEAFPNLKEIDLIKNDNMKEIWHGALPNQYIFNLRSLVLADFPETSITIPNFIIQSLPNLEKLSVKRVALDGLFQSKGLGVEDDHAGTLAEVKELMLSELSLTQVFCNQEILQASGCSELKNLVPSSVSFKHLTTLQVSKCHGFRNLVTFTTAKSMVQLTTMTITNCLMLEEIIASTIDQVTDGIVFNQLKSLELDCLPTLSSFCSGKYAMEFPSLEEVIIKQCPKIKFFTKGKLSTPMLHGLKSTEDEYVGCWEGDLNVTLQQLFAEKIFPSLEDLELSSINIQLAWKHKLLATHPYAQYLTCLTIEGCHNLNCLFPSSTLKSFVQLKKLKIENCENVENVIFVEGSTKEMMNRKLFRVLEFLSLKDLPKLTRFCHGTYFEFPLLTSLSIQTCPTLKTFISDVEGNSSEIVSPALFDEKVVFPCLEEVTIIGVKNWRTIWRQQPTNGVRIHFAIS